MVNGGIRFAVSAAISEEELIVDLERELHRLKRDPAIETTLLIHPGVLEDFFAYCQFLIWANKVLSQHHGKGVYQIASFHPDYCFSNSDVETPANYTNRSPYPMLHLLRESSLEKALAGYPDPGSIPANNIAMLERMGIERVKKMFANQQNTAQKRQ